MVIAAGGGTPLGEALWWVMQQMAPLREKRKIILVLTDGIASNVNSVRQALAAAARYRFEVFGIGYNAEHITALLPHSSRVIHDLRDLAPTMFALLQPALLKNIQEKQR